MIETKEQYDLAVRELDALLKVAKPSAEQEQRLGKLTDLIENYERVVYPLIADELTREAQELGMYDDSGDAPC